VPRTDAGLHAPAFTHKGEESFEVPLGDPIFNLIPPLGEADSREAMQA
jgi:hypothetical protein